MTTQKTTQQKLKPLDLVLQRLKTNQSALARDLKRNRSLVTRWRKQFKGYVPPSAWTDVMDLAHKRKVVLTYDELRDGGFA